MGKDWAFIGQIQLRLEESAAPMAVLRPDHFEGLPSDEITYNCVC